MNRFQYSFYRVTNEKIPNRFEDLFKEIKCQIEIYERQYTLTTKSYVKEWNNEKTKIKEKYNTLLREAEKEYDQIVGTSNDDYTHQFAMNKTGLDAIEYNYSESIQEIDKEYKDFLDLYSKSTMIALYSLNESKLNKIAVVAADLFLKKIKLEHFNNRDYLNSVLDYLNLVIEIDIESLQPHISKLKDIQTFRNKAVHALSVIPEKEAVQIVKKKKNGSLLYDNQTKTVKIISSAYIKDFFSLLKDFYEDLAWLIDKSQNYEILKNGIHYWLAIIDRDLTIEDLTVRSLAASKKQINFKVSTSDKSIPKFICKISLSTAETNSFDVTLQFENAKVKDLINYEKSISGNSLKEVFSTFNLNDFPYQIKLMVYDETV
ncbi:hypothetical protein [Flavobacterium microcysteis]